jgi:cobalt-zinc-cadmium efflux system outer membrane protein
MSGSPCHLIIALVLAGMPLLATAEILTLETARQRALATWPGLAAAGLRLDAAAAEVEQAGRRPNPTMTLEGENLGGDLPASAVAELTATLAQSLELGGRRRLRVAHAAAGRGLAGVELELARRRLLADVDRAFIGLLGAQERLAVAREDAVAAADLAATVAELVRAGEVSPIEADRAAVEAALAASAVTDSVAAVATASARLAGFWGGDEVAADGDLAIVLALAPGWRQRVDPAILPEARRLEAEGQVDSAAAERLRRAARPDLELGVGYRRLSETGDDTFVVGLGLALPLFDRQRDAVAAAELRAAASVRDRDATLASASAELTAAVVELEQAEVAAELAAGTAQPKAREVLTAITDGYVLGEFRLLDVLEARRALAGARRALVAALERQALARAEIARFLPEAMATPGGAQ